ncbi:unnamed protein product [Rotaria sp. Silwood2]|nr:unnamed protein product [Rotaria sp. Silwood2]
MVELGSLSRSDGHENIESPTDQHTHGLVCTDTREVRQTQRMTQTLKVRLWLESGEKHHEGRQFVNYDLLIPNLI